MQFHRAILTRKPAVARVLLLVFAFTAWSITGPANVALALLCALFLTEIPGHWAQLRREPAFLLLLGVLILTSLLALRGAWLFPATATDQWQAISAWVAPLLFIVPAWWLRRDPDQVWPLLGAAALGLALGVMRKGDWSLLPQILEGMRYHFGFAALGLAFIASVILMGLVLFRRRVTGLRICGRPRPLLGWAIWLAGLGCLLAVLVVTQSRGAALILALAGVLYGVIQWRAHHPRGERVGPGRRLRLLASVTLVVAMGALLLWATKQRQLDDWHELTLGGQGAELSYRGPTSIRLNLHQVGLAAFAQRPLLGFGPGTSTTEFLVPQGLVPVSPYHREHAPHASHLHSLALEILARFGLVGVAIALILGWVLARAYRRLWTDDRAPPDLRAFLTIGGVMLVFFCLYDFRVMNLDLRFFCILFLGVLYCFNLGTAAAAEAKGTGDD